jgi:hypothetical protein
MNREESGPSCINSFSLPYEAASSNDGQFDRDITSCKNFSHKCPTSPPPYAACITDHASINDLNWSLSVLHFSSPSTSTISAMVEGYEVTPTTKTELKFPASPAFSSSMQNIKYAYMICTPFIHKRMKIFCEVTDSSLWFEFLAGPHTKIRKRLN